MITLQLKSSCPKIFDHGCSLLKLWKLSLIKYRQFLELFEAGVYTVYWMRSANIYLKILLNLTDIFYNIKAQHTYAFPQNFQVWSTCTIWVLNTPRLLWSLIEITWEYFTAAVPDGFWNISYYNLKLYNCRNRNWKQQILICQQRLKTLSRVLDANSHC